MMEKREEKNNKELNSRSKYAIATVLLIVMIVISGLVTLVTMIYFRHRVREDMNLTKNEEGDPERYYSLVVRDSEDPYWVSAYDSMRKQGELYNVYVDRAGKNLSVDYSKYDLMEMAISSRVDGIIYEADDSEESLKLINKAVAAGIPVVTVRADAPASARRSFVGVSFYNLGTEYGRLITEAGREAVKLKPSDKRDTVSVLVLTDGSIQDTSQNVVLAALKETVQKEAADDSYEIIIGTAQIDNSGEFTAEESVRDLLYSASLPDIIVCLNEVNTESVYQTIVEMNKVGKSIILGYDDSDIILKAIEREGIYASITVDTQQLGQDCVEALNEYIVYKHVSDYYGVDYKIINSKNVTEYRMSEVADEE